MRYAAVPRHYLRGTDGAPTRVVLWVCALNDGAERRAPPPAVLRFEGGEVLDVEHVALEARPQPRAQPQVGRALVEERFELRAVLRARAEVHAEREAAEVGAVREAEVQRVAHSDARRRRSSRARSSRCRGVLASKLLTGAQRRGSRPRSLRRRASST
jgi:hypothetical protein